MPHERDDAPPPEPASTLSGRLERLFEVCRPPHEPRRAWRNSEVVAVCRKAGRDLSESHLSELRRGIKTNPTMRTLESLAWFFEVRVGFFTDDAVAREVETELAARWRSVEAQLASNEAERQESVAAARDLQAALRESGATRMAHRGGSGADSRETAAMMRALAKALREVPDED